MERTPVVNSSSNLTAHIVLHFNLMEPGRFLTLLPSNSFNQAIEMSSLWNCSTNTDTKLYSFSPIEIHSRNCGWSMMNPRQYHRNNYPNVRTIPNTIGSWAASLRFPISMLKQLKPNRIVFRIQFIRGLLSQLYKFELFLYIM